MEVVGVADVLVEQNGNRQIRYRAGTKVSPTLFLNANLGKINLDATGDGFAEFRTELQLQDGPNSKADPIGWMSTVCRLPQLPSDKRLPSRFSIFSLANGIAV